MRLAFRLVNVKILIKGDGQLEYTMIIDDLFWCFLFQQEAWKNPYFRLRSCWIRSLLPLDSMAQ